MGWFANADSGEYEFAIDHAMDALPNGTVGLSGFAEETVIL